MLQKRPYRVPKRPLRKSVFFGNIVLPNDVERERYVKYAIQSNTACVLTPNGEFMKDVPVVYSFCGINDGFVHAIDYPQTSNELGAEVVMVNVPTHNMPIIIGFLPSREAYYDLVEEEHAKWTRVSNKEGDSSSFTIEGFGLQGVINLIAQSNKDGGRINLSASNEQKKGELNFTSNFINIYATSDVLLDVGGEWTVTAENDININSLEGKIKLGDNTEKSAKGETLKDQLSTLADYLIALQVLTPVGNGVPLPDFISKVTAWKQGLNSILSDKVENE